MPLRSFNQAAFAHKAELNCCDRNNMAARPKIFTPWLFTEKVANPVADECLANPLLSLSSPSSFPCPFPSCPAPAHGKSKLGISVPFYRWRNQDLEKF